MKTLLLLALFDSILITGIAPVGNSPHLRISWEGAIPPYKIQMTDRVDGEWRDASWHIYSHHYIISNALPQAYYRVRTIPDRTPPPPLKGFGPRQVTCRAVQFSWDPLLPDTIGGTGLRGTRIYRDGVFLAEIPFDSVAFADDTVTPGVAYVYQATAVDNAGNESPPSSFKSVVVLVCGVNLGWDPNPEPDIAGYFISYGTTSGAYTERIDVGNVLMYRVQGLLLNTDYYFVVSAYNTSGLEGDPSNEVTYRVP